MTTPYCIEKIVSDLTLSPRARINIECQRQQIQSILRGEDPRLLLIVGPCALQLSAHMIEYAERLQALQNEVNESFLIIMRAYFEKGRTGIGWKGSIHTAPSLSSGSTSSLKIESPESRLFATRQFLLALAERGIPLAAEFIDPLVAPLLSDLFSWGSIGARTVHSQTHRILASTFPFPCGMKNSVEGSISAACHAIAVASHPHTHFSIDMRGKLASITSSGNPYAHLVLRGGAEKPNYSAEDMQRAQAQLQSMGLPESMIVDCSHGNSQKQYSRQEHIFKTVIENYTQGNTPSLKGLMLESFLIDGSLQELMKSSLPEHEKLSLLERVSHIDPCMGWEMTESLIRHGHAQLLKHLPISAVERSDKATIAYVLT